MQNFNIKCRDSIKETENLNTSLLCGWSLIIISLLLAYCVETVMGRRSAGYFVIFSILTAVPNTISWIIYAKHKSWEYFKYFIIGGYLIMYTFVLFTAGSILCFTYILPLLSLLILYHDPELILGTGFASIILNGASMMCQMCKNPQSLNVKDMEIQIALIILCFLGSYIATRYYKKYTDNNQKYMYTIISQIEKINKMSLQTIMTIANMIDARDGYTKGHSSRVADYTALLAYKLGMSKKEIEDIHSIALLHDIGKVGIPDSILNKSGRLTDEEYQIMKNHTVIGGNILKDMTMLPDIDLGAKYHHERYDGKGYPDGLKGEEIPYTARIISVADAFDAMTSDRIYRKHLDSIIVIKEIEKGAGTQFDPEIAEAMLDLIKTEKIKLNYSDLLDQIDLAETLNTLYPDKEFYDATD